MRRLVVPLLFEIMNAETPLSVSIENDQIVIRVGIARLNGSAYHTHLPTLPITDREAWAKSVAYELMRESDDGETLPSRMFDDAMQWALDDGAQGIDYKRPTQRDDDGMPIRHNVKSAPTGAVEGMLKCN